MSPQEFQSVYDASFRIVNGVLSRYPISADEREDILQATFLGFWLYAQTLRVENPCAFLVKSARNNAHSLLRGRRIRRSDSLEDHPEPDADTLASGNARGGKDQDLRERKIALVREALAEHTRTSGNPTLWDRYAEGRRLRDIAKTRGEPIGTVCARVNVARLPRRLVENLRAGVARLGREMEVL